MTRLLLSTAAAIALLAAPISAIAQPAPGKPAATKPVKHMAAKHTMAKPVSAKAKAMPHRTPGDAAVDALNDQSLARAKAGQ